nr:TlpA disulfide reductase family protein [Pedobacter sp. ASV2]
MKLIFILFLTAIFYTSSAQVKLLTIDELNHRIENGKDTTYVVNFWATWCAPCVAELPNFEKLRLANMNEPVKVLLVSLDFKSKLSKAVIPFVEANKLQSEVFLLNESNQQEYIQRINKKWSGGIPATLFVYKKKRQFFEKEFSEEELKNTLLAIKREKE